MTNEQILEKAIKKAIKNGYEFIQYDNNGKNPTSSKGDKIKWDTFNLDGKIISFWTDKTLWQRGIFEVIFSHSFAKALWGEKLIETDKILYFNEDMQCDEVIKNWQYHIQQMVLKKEPLKYIEEFNPNQMKKTMSQVKKYDL